jgi:hypothetical protein
MAGYLPKFVIVARGLSSGPAQNDDTARNLSRKAVMVNNEPDTSVTVGDNAQETFWIAGPACSRRM